MSFVSVSGWSSRARPKLPFGRSEPPLKVIAPAPSEVAVPTSTICVVLLMVEPPLKLFGVLISTVPPPLVTLKDCAWTVLLRMPNWTLFAPMSTGVLIEKAPLVPPTPPPPMRYVLPEPAPRVAAVYAANDWLERPPPRNVLPPAMVLWLSATL